MQITEVGTGVFAVEGDAVNWTIITDGDALTLVDAGYPGDVDDVLASIAEIGHRLDDVEAVLVTHAHIDHIGGIPKLLEQYPVPVLLSTTEARHARREFLEQAGTLDVVRNLWRPRVLPWSVNLMRKGAMNDAPVPSATGFGEVDVINIPGRPVPVPTPGHTSGHTAYLLPEARVLLTGDALVTGHPLSATTGPQMLLDFFHYDSRAAYRALDVIADVDADVIVPGHGPVHHGSPRDAATTARL